MPVGFTAEKACNALKTKFSIDLDALFPASLSPSVKHHWDSLHCYDVLRSTIKQASVVVPGLRIDSELPSATLRGMGKSNNVEGIDHQVDPVSTANSLVAKQSKSISMVDTTASEKKTTNTMSFDIHKLRCVEYRDTYNVAPGSSWGTLPDHLQMYDVVE